MSIVEDWRDLMDSHFPMATSDGMAELAFVRGSSQIDGGEFEACVRLIVFEGDGESRSLRDIKEQIVSAGSEEHFADRDRYDAFLRALGTVIGDLSGDAVKAELPHELFPAEVLELKAQTFDDFGRALSAKSRLGRYLA